MKSLTIQFDGSNFFATSNGVAIDDAFMRKLTAEDLKEVFVLSCLLTGDFVVFINYLKEGVIDKEEFFVIAADLLLHFKSNNNAPQEAALKLQKSFNDFSGVLEGLTEDDLIDYTDKKFTEAQLAVVLDVVISGDSFDYFDFSEYMSEEVFDSIMDYLESRLGVNEGEIDEQ